MTITCMIMHLKVAAGAFPAFALSSKLHALVLHCETLDAFADASTDGRRNRPCAHGEEVTLLAAVLRHHPQQDLLHFLMEAIASVLAQTERDPELLVVNDGDALPPLPIDPRLRHLENAHGAVPAREFGVTSARGRFIAFLDDDDRWTSPDHLQLARAALDAGVDFTFSDGTMQFR
ncbi:MAG: glycosyltransferase family A protein [Hyphomicrobiales bacterium]